VFRHGDLFQKIDQDRLLDKTHSLLRALDMASFAMSFWDAEHSIEFFTISYQPPHHPVVDPQVIR
jgi:hypothetical protein